MSEPIEPVLLLGDCVEVMRTMEANSVDAVVTDPPAGIAFMAKTWDSPGAWEYPISGQGFTDGGQRLPTPGIASSRNPMCQVCHRHKRGKEACTCAVPQFDDATDRLRARTAFCGFMRQVMDECFRVLKPGGHALVWAIPRTSHWTATAVEDAGFDVRDMCVHLFGSGFPKSLDVSKAIDKAAGAQREVIGTKRGVGGDNLNDIVRGSEVRTTEDEGGKGDITAPATPEAKQWSGFGTALKPAAEFWILARKPLIGNVATNVLTYGTGALNIDGCRVTTGDSLGGGAETITRADQKGNEGWTRPWMEDAEAQESHAERVRANVTKAEQLGRWPSNLLLSHSPNCELVGTKQIKAITGTSAGRMKPGWSSEVYGTYAGDPDKAGAPTGYGDEDGREMVEEWRCSESCPVAELDRQSGDRKAGGRVRGTEPSRTGAHGIYNDYGAQNVHEPRDDEGGCSRFFPIFPGGKPWENPTHGESTTDVTEGGTANGESQAAESYTNSLKADGFGSESTDPSPTDMKSTTPTTTTPTIPLRTSDASPPSGMTTIINDSESSTDSPMELRSDFANDAENGDPSLTTPSDAQEPTRDTANPVRSSTSESGSNPTQINDGCTTKENEPNLASSPDPDLDSRFFPTFKYQAKPSRAERNQGTEVMPSGRGRNDHPT